jgi:CRISPR/Cas system-associated exonuclease Cas4 (RecB family)
MMIPSPEVIESLSVSNAVSLNECEMQLAFSRDIKFAVLNRTSVHAHLGLAIHKVSETFRSDIAADEFDEWFERVWGQAIDYQFNKFQSEIYPSITRSPKFWPNYALKKLSLKKALRKRLSSGAVQPYSYIRVPLEGVEIKLPSDSSLLGQIRIHGRVDEIRNFQGMPQIVDLKSGDSEDANRKTQLQLALYAYLYFYETNVFPTCARQSVNGNFEPFKDLTKQEVERKYKAIMLDLDAFNQHVNEGTFRYTATLSSCSSCNYRAVCDGFKSSELNTGSLKVVQGTVEAVSNNGEDSCTITVRSDQVEDPLEFVSNLNPEPWKDALGKKVSFTSLVASGGSNSQFRFTEFSRGICLQE